jgi:hypothetical protein
VVLIKKGCVKPSVKILKTPDNSFLALKRIAGVNFFLRVRYQLTMAIWIARDNPDRRDPESVYC